MSLLKDFSADATVAGIVNNILKLTKTFRNISKSLQSVKKIATLKVSVLVFQTVLYVLMVNVAFLLQNLHNSGQWNICVLTYSLLKIPKNNNKRFTGSGRMFRLYPSLIGPVLPKASTRPTLCSTAHMMKQSNLIKREQTGQSLQSTSCN